MSLIGDSAVRVRQASPLGKSSVVSILSLLYTSAIMMYAGTAHAQYTDNNQTNIISGVMSNWVDDPLNPTAGYVVGSNLTFDVLLIQNGGVLSNGNGSIGGGSSAHTGNNIAIVSGNGSTWNNDGGLLVGPAGNFHQLIITNGGAVYDNDGQVGFPVTAGGFGADSILVTGSGSIWSNRNGLELRGGNSTLTIANGGAVLNSNATINTEFGTRLLVTGTGSTWNISSTLTLFSMLSTMIVSNGGFVHSGSVNMLTEGFSVQVTGTGSVWSVDSSLSIKSGFMGPCSITVSDQGAVSASTIGVTGSRLTISGGSLFATNSQITGGITLSGSSTLTLNSGTVQADSLAATPSDFGTIVFNGGTLRTKTTTINSSLAFVVGNGTDSATFILDKGGSGFHSFANGLTISSNAALRGFGTIIGSTTVNGGGLLSPGTSPGSITFSNSLTLAPNSTFAVELDGNAEGQYDRIVALDTVSLSNSVLNVSLGFTPAVGDSFTIISNLGPGAVFGTFLDTQGDPLMNGDTFLLDGTLFEISYDGNPDGQDVILTAVIPEPATWLLAVLGLVVLHRRRRRDQAQPAILCSRRL